MQGSRISVRGRKIQEMAGFSLQVGGVPGEQGAGGATCMHARAYRHMARNTAPDSPGEQLPQLPAGKSGGQVR